MKHKAIRDVITIVLVLFVGLLSQQSCKSAIPVEDTPETPLNVSVFIDLSDRLKKELVPSQMERDTALINHLIDIFVNDCIVNGKIANSRNCFRIIFYPTPKSSEIALLSEGLNVDLSKTDIKMKKEIISGMKKRFDDNLSQIYKETLLQNKWPGCDIWGFFGNKKVDELCIRKDYRNIMVILSDGYIYHEDNKTIDGKAYSYILPQTLQIPESSLIVKRNGLENLEVLMMEVNPGNPKFYVPMENVLNNWFIGMGVKRFVLTDTDTPVNSKRIIDNFFENKDID